MGEAVKVRHYKDEDSLPDEEHLSNQSIFLCQISFEIKLSNQKAFRQFQRAQKMQEFLLPEKKF